MCKAESRSGNFPHFVKGNVLRRRGEEIPSVDVVFADLPGQVLSCQVLVAGCQYELPACLSAQAFCPAPAPAGEEAGISL